MAEFNRYVKIGEPAAIAAGIDAGMVKLAEKHDNVIAVLQDLGYPSVSWFKENAPERILETGIAEGNASVAAAGLAAEGYMPILYGLAFATLGRAYFALKHDCSQGKRTILRKSKTTYS